MWSSPDTVTSCRIDGGVAGDRTTAQGQGEDHPAACHDTVVGRQTWRFSILLEAAVGLGDV
jgi:hypothetical protein